MKSLISLIFLICLNNQALPAESNKNYSDSLPTIASRYPNDVGIEKDSNVLFAEMFNDGWDNILKRYTDIKNKDGMSVSKQDIPRGSRQAALTITNIGGVNEGGHLFKRFTPGFDSMVFIRYYVKYPLSSNGFIHHQSVRVGGHNPPSDYHFGQAGICGLGDKRMSMSYEPVNEPAMDTYLYWGDMKSWNGGTSCYGNDMVNGSPTARNLEWDKWMCVEMMIKLNNPVTAYNGELKIWQDGVLVGHWGPGFPNGKWDKDSWFNIPDAPPFRGFRWRTDPGLKLSYICIEFYDSKSPPGVSHHIKYSNVVVAKQYIGPIKSN